jgi:3-oxoacyl-[acyl-carrier protein] reductase
MKDKIVCITGSSLGIGKETAYKFATEGCKVIITYYKDKDEAKKVESKCRELGASDTLVLKLDLREDANIKDFVQEIVDKFKHIHVLINNAGVLVQKPLKEQSFEEIENQVRINLEGQMKITKELMPFIKETIINISSGAGKHAYGGMAPYCATKFGVRGFTQALAQEVHDLRVYSVNPGLTATRMTNFQGTEPEEVAGIIVRTAKGYYKVKSGSDIDVEDILE